MNYLLDTCVISELIAKRPNEKVVSWVDSQAEDRLYLSVNTIGEIVKGIEMPADSQRKEALNAWLEDELLERIKGLLNRNFGNLKKIRGRQPSPSPHPFLLTTAN